MKIVLLFLALAVTVVLGQWGWVRLFTFILFFVREFKMFNIFLEILSPMSVKPKPLYM